MTENLNNNSNLNEFDLLRQELLKNPQPNSNYETAVFLLKNSSLTTDLSEIEKEIKLSNLDDKEKIKILSLLGSYQDQLLLNSMQFNKYQNFILSKKDLSDDEIQNLISLKTDLDNSKLDLSNHLRKALTIAVTSRGYKGFERESQIKTIQTTSLTGGSEFQQPLSLKQKLFGGGIR